MSATRPKSKPNVLFLCTGNSCRSQMAEGWARAVKGEEITPFSAGIEKHGLDPKAVAVMREAGVDISRQTSKTLGELPDLQFDLVVTVCEHADKNCPVLPGAVKKIHVAFDDPPRLARSATSKAEAVAHYRRVRDEIRTFIETLPDLLE